MDTPHAPESFRGLLLRHRGRTGLIQREVAARAGVSLRSVQDWESGVGFWRSSAWVADEVAASFERVYWRSLRDAPPVTEWLAGAIGFLCIA